MNITLQEALEKLRKYCAYQERCHKEVREKLMDIGVRDPGMQNEVMDRLIKEKFLDEERFARSFARGKFRMKQWGRKKIVIELKRRDISSYCIQAGLSEIGEQEYRKTAADLFAKKYKEQRGVKPEAARKNKTVTYLVSKGFEPELAWEISGDLAEEQ